MVFNKGRLASKRAFLIGGAVVILALLTYGIFRVLNRPFELPFQFIIARDEAGRVSQEIVDLTGRTIGLIKNANVSDFAGAASDAVKLINEARQANERSYNKAFELSLAVQKMAEALSDIRPREVQQIAYEAASIELALISDFISYTQYLNQFLDFLAIAVRTDNRSDRQAAASALAEVNQKITSINNLNQAFFAKMAKLDSLNKGQ
jgi:hypothetical protein